MLCVHRHVWVCAAFMFGEGKCYMWKGTTTAGLIESVFWDVRSESKVLIYLKMLLCLKKIVSWLCAVVSAMEEWHSSSLIFLTQGMSSLGSSATWEHPQWVATMFAISKRREGEWLWERKERFGFWMAGRSCIACPHTKIYECLLSHNTFLLSHSISGMKATNVI